MKKAVSTLLCLTLLFGLTGCGYASKSSGQTIKVGDYITFGHYEQDNDIENGAESIEWIVLETDGRTATLLSRYALDCKPYCAQRVKTGWETSTLRTWLNTDFLNTAFTADEQAKLMTTTVTTYNNLKYFEDTPYDNTRDRVFLLSLDEIRQYIPVDTDRKTEATAYAQARGAYVGTNGCTNWWSRSSGHRSDEAAFVAWGGGIGTEGTFPFVSAVNEQHNAVRPVVVLWLSETGKPAESEEETEIGEAEQAAAEQAFVTGSIVTFGHYEQDNDSSNGTEPIEWIVLDTDGDIAILLARFGLDAMPFNKKDIHVTWENCTLRAWMNDDFLKTAFTQEEQEKLATVFVKADNASESETDLGNDTHDRVFLLSIREAENYMPEEELRKTSPTTYAEIRGAFANNNYYSSWWLRSHGNRESAAKVGGNGGISYNGVVQSDNVVRPVIVLRLHADEDNTEVSLKLPEAEEPVETEAAPAEQINIIMFGHYEQDNDTDNGPEEIEWIVLESDDETATLISRYGLDSRRFNEGLWEIATWETCTLRAWLNRDFLTMAFTEDEQAQLATVTVKAEKGRYYDTDPGNDTQDRVFLLNENEVSQYDYFSFEEERQMKATPYAIAQGAFVDNENGCSHWWLRTPGSYSYKCEAMDTKGFIGDILIFEDGSVVRPVIVLKLH